MHKGHGHKTMIPQGQKLNIIKVMFKLSCLEKGHSEFQVHVFNLTSPIEINNFTLISGWSIQFLSIWVVNVGNALANDFKPDDAFFVYILIGFVLVHLILFIKFCSCQIRSLFKIRAKLDVASESCSVSASCTI